MLRLLGYVKSTSHYQLRLSHIKPELVVYSDADFAANRDNRTSIGSHIVMLDNAPVDWCTFKEKCISLSPMESEFMAEAAKNLVLFNRILEECQKFKLIPKGVMVQF